MYLLDTNTLIYFFKDIGNVAETLLSKSPKNISIPSIVLYELEVGIAKSNNPKKRKKQLEALTSRITVQSFTPREAEAAAIIRANLEKLGTPIGPYDTLIAGMALSINATLVTNNTREFQRVAGLSLEDWF
ncbi:MAG: type II toxin-antitoxin system VapC family toxin [Candidatus Electrothrix sp. AW2]|nr:type II toxin-antitoxin system VapC family toxin [Candidatus Electrothrix gigas]MCI5195892.1 type II toxin-antitoxin system VapC family toxin [Candidatus Electrothrix gigas]MCI5227859.1 type II toxin-antitoxin system VapC family toxin [Candidatus Electrothrix gigas]